MSLISRVNTSGYENKAASKKGSLFFWISLYSAIALSIFLFLFLKPDPTKAVVVFFDGNLTEAEIVTSIISAGGLIIDRRSASQYILRDSLDQHATFFDRLNNQGAWLILNGQNGFGCAAVPTKAFFANNKKPQITNIQSDFSIE